MLFDGFMIRIPGSILLSKTTSSALDYLNRYISPKLSHSIVRGAQGTPLARVLVSLMEGSISFMLFFKRALFSKQPRHFSSIRLSIEEH